jgi:septal ring factor EnvC (AmiA/AmiB activator)
MDDPAPPQTPNDQQGPPELAEIEREIAETREQLAETVAALAEKTDGKKHVRAKVDKVKKSAKTIQTGIAAAAVIAFVLAWIWRRR